MKILMPVSFRAQGGGLHDHVLALALGARHFGNEITVVGAPGLFLEHLRDHGVDTISADLGRFRHTLARVDEHSSHWDLIHSHPFTARDFGVVASESLNLPLVVTMHGWYDDHIERWYDSASAVIAVTPAIAHRLRATVGGSGERIVTIPNGVKVDPAWARPEIALTPPYRLTVVSRVDADFAPVGHLLRQFISAAQAEADERWRVVLAGTGTHLPALARELAKQAYAKTGPSVHLRGWVDGPELEDLYASSFAAVAPGRAAVDAMASGVPTVMTRQIGVYSLLGDDQPVRHLTGFPGQPQELNLYASLCALADHPDQWEAIARSTQRAASLYYDDMTAQRLTNGLYEFVKLERLVNM